MELAESYRLPSTLGTLEEHIKQVRLQSRAWYQATNMQQQPFDPLKLGYYKDTCGQLLPVTTEVHPTSKAIIQLERCQWESNYSTQRCSGKRNDLPCTELCFSDSEGANDEDYNISKDDSDDHDNDE
ncbi:hypothetical protein SK128_028609 [Halocaridina rubra]|uniref:Uncharacterized protein n=1 Tax=Halocaridina rubra TaxID=373956 RepID=A0AAN8ZQ13_HALRR